MAFKDEYTNAYVTPERPYKEDDPWVHGDVNNIIAGIEECKEAEDGKLDKINSNGSSIQAYVVSKNGNIQTTLPVSVSPANATIPCYENENLNVGTPIEDTHAANKKYVDEQIANSSSGGSGDLSNYVQKTDYAIGGMGDGTGFKEGIISINPFMNGGIMTDISGRGRLMIAKAARSNIDDREPSNYVGIDTFGPNHCRPIVPANLDYAVMKALADCKIKNEWTSDRKMAARELFGIPEGSGENADLSNYVQKTDYATNQGGHGLVKVDGSFGVYLPNGASGALGINVASESEIISGHQISGTYRPIPLKQIDLAVLMALSDCKIKDKWTNTEKIAASKLIQPSFEHIGTIIVGQPVEEGSLLTAVEAGGTFEAVPQGKKYQEIMIYLANFQSASNVLVDGGIVLNGGQNASSCALNQQASDAKVLHVVANGYFMEVEVCTERTGKCDKAIRHIPDNIDYYINNKIHSVQITNCFAGATMIVYGIPA